MEKDSEMVLLNNGAQVSASTTRVMSLRLEFLKSKNFPVFKDLFEKCKNPDHEISAEALGILPGLNLLEKDGSVHDSIKNIVLSAVQEVGETLVLIDPIKKVVVEEITDVLKEDPKKLIVDVAEVVPDLPELVVPPEEDATENLIDEEKIKTVEIPPKRD